MFPLDEADFVGGKYQLHFENGSVSGAIDCIDIEIIDDYIKEGNESFLAVLSPGGDEAVHLVNHYADVYIIDDDCMLVLSGFSQHPTSDLLKSCRGECDSVTGEPSWYSKRE